MAHRMGLAGLTMGTNASAVTTITYDGNTSTELYRSTGTTSTTSLALFDNFSPLNSSSTYYYIVKHLTAYTLNSGYKVTTTSGDPVYQWSQAITNSQIDKGNYKAFSPTPAFRNFARRYSYTGTSQTFTPIIACLHKMECWGARGGKDISQKKLNTAFYGKGGYVRGNILLTAIQPFYVYVGNVGGDAQISGSRTTAGGTGGWNGGGSGSYDEQDDDGDGGGGGATDIRLNYSSDCLNLTSLKSRIMVAGGGGGSGGSNWNGSTAGCGGNIIGGYATYTSSKTQVTYSPGTQTGGYRFGAGRSHTRTYTNIESGGGGGGYYGGDTNTGSSSQDWAGCGGSSFISGYTGCNAIKESCSVNTGGESNHTGSPNHYSNLIFNDGTMIMISGATSGMPNPNEASLNSNTTTGNDGPGYARITIIPYGD